MSSSKRGRKLMTNLPPNRARDVQRAFRARRAAHLEAMEHRINDLEEENDALRAALRLPKANRPALGKGPTGKDKPRSYASQNRSLAELGILPTSGNPPVQPPLKSISLGDGSRNSNSPPSGPASLHNTPQMPGMNGMEWGQVSDRTSRGSVSPPMTASSHTSPLMGVQHKPLPAAHAGQYSYVGGSPRSSVGSANGAPAGQMYPPAQPQAANPYAASSHDNLASAPNGNAYNAAPTSRMSTDYSAQSYANSGLPAYQTYSSMPPPSQVPTPEPRATANGQSSYGQPSMGSLSRTPPISDGLSHHRRSSTDMHTFRPASTASYHSSGAPTPIPSFSHLTFSNGRDLTHSPAPAHTHLQPYPS